MFGDASALGNLPRWAVIKDARGRQRRRRRRTLVAILTLLVVAGAVLLTQRSTAGGPAAPVSSVSSGVDSVGLGGLVVDTTSMGNHVWALVCVRSCAGAGTDRDQLVEIDPATNRVIDRLPQSDAASVVSGEGSLWVAHFLSGEISRIDPLNGRATAALRLKLPAPIVTHLRNVVRRDRKFLPSGISYGNGDVWSSTARGWTAEIDARTGRLVAMIASPSEATSTATDGHGTWVAENLGGIGSVAPNRHRLVIRPIRWQDQVVDINTVRSGGGLIWAIGQVLAGTTNPTSTVVTMIDPVAGRIVHQRQLQATGGAVVTSGSLYLGDLKHGRVLRLSRDGTTETLAAPHSNAVLATATPGTLWATTTTSPGRLIPIKLARPAQISG